MTKRNLILGLATLALGLTMSACTEAPAPDAAPDMGGSCRRRPEHTLRPLADGLRQPAAVDQYHDV